MRIYIIIERRGIKGVIKGGKFKGGVLVLIIYSLLYYNVRTILA